MLARRDASAMRGPQSGEALTSLAVQPNANGQRNARGGTDATPTALATGPSSASQPASEGPAPWKEVDWRSHQRWVHVQGRAINLVELGSGEPVLFVHGLGGSWTNWLEQLPVLAARRRVIALDLPGFGHSPMPASSVSIDGYAHLLQGLLEALEIESAAVVGNSMGGEIAVELALAAPALVERLVLVSPAGISTAAVIARLPLIRRIHPPLDVINRWIADNAEAVARRPRLRRLTMSVVASQPQRIPAAFVSEQLRGLGKAGFLPALEALVSHSAQLQERLSGVACPTLILWGARDPVISAGDAEVFHARIPNSRKVVWQDVGHVAMFERAADFNALLESFLSE